MKTAIFYKTKYGVTEQYAKWIHEAVVDSEIYSIDDFPNMDFSNFDTIVIGTNTYMGSLVGLDFLIDNWEMIKNKNVCFFSVGIFPPESPESQRSYKSIPEDIRSQIKYYKLPGRVRRKDLDFFDNLVLADTEIKNQEIKKENIQPLVNYLKSLA